MVVVGSELVAIPIELHCKVRALICYLYTYIHIIYTGVWMKACKLHVFICVYYAWLQSVLHSVVHLFGWLSLLFFKNWHGNCTTSYS